MNTYYSEAIGLVAAALTTSSFLPQALKTFKTKDTKSISLLMYSLFCAGVALWLIYGLLISSISIIAANVVTFGLAISVLIMKIRYG